MNKIIIICLLSCFCILMMPNISSLQINIYEDLIEEKSECYISFVNKISFFLQYPFLDFILSLILIFINIIYIINGVIGLIFFRIGDIIELYYSNLGQFLQWISLFISTIGFIFFFTINILLKSIINQNLLV